jgi:hypothetical protein
MEVIPEFLLLFALAVAGGLDLFLTLFVVAAVTYLDLPTGGAGLPLEGLLLLLVLIGLSLAEAAAEMRPLPALIWNGVQILLRPLGGALLALLLLEGRGWPLILLGMAMAGVVAAYHHVVSWGRGLRLRLLPSRSFSPLVHRAGLWILTMTLIILALAHPESGAVAGGVLTLLGLAAGRDNHAATRFGLVLLRSKTWGILSPPKWAEEGELPPWVRKAFASRRPRGLRGTRAAIWGFSPRPRFREGWLLRGGEDLLFAYRSGWRVREIRITDPPGESLPRQICLEVPYGSEEGRPSALFLQAGLNSPKPHKW